MNNKRVFLITYNVVWSITCSRVWVGKNSTDSNVKMDQARPQYSGEEREVREELAAAYRIAVMLGWEHIIHTHITVRCPDQDREHFLINPFGFMFDGTCTDLLIFLSLWSPIADSFIERSLDLEEYNDDGPFFNYFGDLLILLPPHPAPTYLRNHCLQPRKGGCRGEHYRGEQSSLSIICCE